MHSIPRRIGLAAIAVLLTPSPAAPAGPQPYAITARMPIGGDGGWDALACDPASHRLYLSRGSHVQVVDTRSDSLVGDIPNTPGVHGIALAPDLGRGFTSNGRDSSVTVFDLGTLATLATIKLPGANPDAILYDPASRHVFAFNAGSSSVSKIDPSSNRVVGTLPLGGRPEFAVADGKGRVYVNLEDSSAVACFDAAGLELLSTWPLAPGAEPTGIAMDVTTHRVFSACANKRLIALDSETGRRVADLPIGERVDGLAFDPGLARVLSTNGEGTLSVIQEDAAGGLTKVADVPTQRGARTVALDPLTHRVYTVTAQFGDTPPATAEQPHPRPRIVPGSFVVLALDADVAAPAPAAEYRPAIDPANFSATVDHPYFPLVPGTTFRFLESSGGHVSDDEVTVTHATRVVMGVKCVVVHDVARERGVVTEETDDWYAQDRRGAVWYFGEATKEFRANGTASTAGSWEAGVRGAQPGIVMPAEVKPGAPYRQEYLAGEAEDMGQVVATGESVGVPFGAFTGCVRTKEWSPLESGSESKWYARGVGLVRSESSGGEVAKLVSVVRPGAPPRRAKR